MKTRLGALMTLLALGTLAGCGGTGGTSYNVSPDMAASGDASSNVESGMPSAGSATDVTDFTGAPAGQAPGGLRALGYEPIRSQGLTTWWFNRDTGACAEIVTADGRYSSVTMLPAEDC